MNQSSLTDGFSAIISDVNKTEHRAGSLSSSQFFADPGRRLILPTAPTISIQSPVHYFHGISIPGLLLFEDDAALKTKSIEMGNETSSEVSPTAGGPVAPKRDVQKLGSRLQEKISRGVSYNMKVW